MSVVAFERKPSAGLWTETELNAMLAALNVAIASGGGRGWETGMTETGDAQEDGSGQFLFEHQSLALVALHAKAAVRSMRGWLVVRAVLVWCTIRQMIHDKVEPLLDEGEELLVELVPQLAAFA